MPRIYLMILVLLLAIFLQPTTVLSANPSLKILKPVEGSTSEGYIVEVKFEVKNFTLRDHRISSPSKSGQGHLNLWLDNDASDPGQVRKWSRDIPYTFADVPPGNHVLTVELVGNDGQSLNPKVAQVVNFRTAVLSQQKEAVKEFDESNRQVSGSTSTKVTTEGTESVTDSKFSKIKFPVFVGSAAFILGIIGFLILKH